MNISIKAKSSSGDSYYTVDFFIKDEVLSVLCDCPAGDWGKFCKHKWQLLNGDETMIFDPEQSAQLASVTKIAVAKGIKDLYEKFEKQEADLKIKIKAQKKEKSSLKKRLAKKDLLTEDQFQQENEVAYELDRDVAYISYLVAKEKEMVEKKLKTGF